MLDKLKAATLQTVLDRLGQTKLADKAKRDCESAIHVFCRELNRRPDEVPLQQVEQLGEGLNAARMGVTQGRVNNIRSLVRRAVAATVANLPRRRLDTPLPTLWHRLSALATDRGERFVLRALFRIFVLLELEPGSLTSASFEQARVYLRDSGRSRPEATYRRMVIAWNRLVTLLRPFQT
jgi:hypothetical protein